MADVVERYLQLGLRLGRLEDGMVDAYFGPAALADAVAEEPQPTAEAVVAQAEELLSELPDGWLRDQVIGVRTYAGVLAGETYSFADEVEGCYGVRPHYTDESVFEAAQEQLADLLPGTGTVAERYYAWRSSQEVPADGFEPLARAVIARARAWTEELVALPPGEEIELELVRDQPWSGYQRYLGGLRGRISVNTDVARPFLEVLHLMIHETYPGHQAERVLKDHHLVRGQGRLEETLVLLPAPQSLVSEGLAEHAVDLVLQSPAGQEMAARAGFDLESALAIERAYEPLIWASVNAAMLLSDSGYTDDQLRDYLRRWTLGQEQQIEHILRFLAAPGNRTYIVVYPVGRDRCRGFVNGDVSRFRRLLTEQIRVGDL